MRLGIWIVIQVENLRAMKKLHFVLLTHQNQHNRRRVHRRRKNCHFSAVRGPSSLIVALLIAVGISQKNLAWSLRQCRRHRLELYQKRHRVLLQVD